MRKKLLLTLSMALIVLFTSNVFAQSVVFRYKFESNLENSQGSAPAMTVPPIFTTNFHEFVDGKYGKALKLPGVTGQFLEIDKSDLLNPAEAGFTVCAWVLNQSETTHHREHIILHQTATTTSTGTGATRYLIALKGPVTAVDPLIPSPNLFVGNYMGGYNSDGKIEVKRNEWTHTAIVGDAVNKTMTIYVNGELDAVVDLAAAGKTIEASTFGFRVGKHRTNTLPQDASTYVGLLDDLCLFKGMLTQDQVKGIMNGGDLVITSNAKTATSGVTVYSNPATNKLHISGVEGIQSVTVFDMIGKTVCQVNKFNGTTIDISSLVSGQYIAQIKTLGNNQVVKFNKK